MPVALGITTRDSGFSIALRTEDGTVTLARACGENTRNLTATVAAAFVQAGLRPRDLSELRLDIGPGSYTGLRVAVTFARVAHSFHDVSVRTVTSLQLMALASWASGDVDGDCPIRPVLDARRQRFYHARIRLGDRAALSEAPRATAADEVHESISSDETVVAAGALHPLLATSRAKALIEPAPFDARLLFDGRLALCEPPSDGLEPLYLMGSYAE